VDGREATRIFDGPSSPYRHLYLTAMSAMSGNRLLLQLFLEGSSPLCPDNTGRHEKNSTG
jgi:hypothetical protein